jgi:O-antigen/teichoic acid export membrane protein
MWVGICLNLDLFAELFLKKKIYHEGLVVVPWLLAGYLFLGVYYNLATWFKLTDKTQYGTWLTLTGAGITIATSFLLVPMIGYLGFIMLSLCYYFGQKFYPVPYDVISAVGYIGAGAIVIYGSTLFKIHDLWVSVPVHMAVLAVFMFVVFLIERKNIPAFKRK